MSTAIVLVRLNDRQVDEIAQAAEHSAFASDDGVPRFAAELTALRKEGQVPEIRVDKTKCQGHAMCYGVEPELFPLDDQGYSALTTLAISEDDKPAALRGMTACPERAITVADEPHVRSPQATPKSGLTSHTHKQV